MAILKLLTFVVLLPIFKLVNEILILTSLFQGDNINFYQWKPHGRLQLDEYNLQTLNEINSTSMSYIIIHGWRENSTQEEYEIIARNYYILDQDSNIILFDYGDLAADSYLEAPEIVSRAGKAIGYKLVTLINLKLLHPKRIQIFSHSLGAHVAGYAAGVIREEIQETIARISATDPAGPLFRAPFGIGSLSDALSKDDAVLLDITHTSYLAGTFEAFGTVDVYVDLVQGRQPPCLGRIDADDLLFCDHRMARAYFTESILSCGFHQSRRGKRDERVVYGQHMPANTSGVFRMKVNAKIPYAKDFNSFPNC